MTREELVGTLSRLEASARVLVEDIESIQQDCSVSEYARVHGNAANTMRGLTRLLGVAQADHAQSVIEELDEMRRQREEVMLNEYAPLTEDAP